MPDNDSAKTHSREDAMEKVKKIGILALATFLALGVVMRIASKNEEEDPFETNPPTFI